MSTTYNSDGSQSDVQAKINLAIDGDTVTIPASSSNTWTSTITISGKGIKIQGLGTARKVLGRSTSSVAFGTSGSKSFTTTVSGLSIIAGDLLRIYRLGGETNVGQGFGTGNSIYMDCTVDSYSGTSLSVTVNSGSVTGTGSYAAWVICTNPTNASRIIHNAGAVGLFNITEDTSNSTEITGIQFETISSATGWYIYLLRASGGKPILIHDNWFQVGDGVVLGTEAVHTNSNQGVIWNCYFLSESYSSAPVAWHHVATGLTSAWASASTFGALDTTGLNNVYFEDCWFVAQLNAFDLDANAKAVIRYCHLDHAAVGTHGADTGSPAEGVRHFEVYNTTFYHVNQGSASPGVNWFFYVRGGTFVVTDCVLPLIDTSSWWGFKATFNCTIQNLTRNAGSFPLWGKDLPGFQIPAPRQVGYGNPDGSSSVLDPLNIAVLGVPEPAYLWNNTGSPSVGVSDWGTVDAGMDSSADYIVAGREFIENTAKPGYSKYVYPHPLRGAQSSPYVRYKRHSRHLKLSFLA